MPKIENTPDSKLKITLENGPEVFTANDPMEATNQLATALDEGKKWGKAGHERAKQLETENETLKQQLAAQQQPPPQEQASFKIDKPTADFMTEAVAIGLGFNNRTELIAYNKTREEREQERTNRDVASTFLAAHPEFPNTQPAIDELSKAIDITAGGVYSTGSLEGAHAYCVLNEKYKILDIDEQRRALSDQAAIQQQRGTPPPMIRSSAPDNNRIANAYEEPLGDLRARVIREQLASR